jgi:DNA-binding beta-propeller fold protein YncE
MKTLYNFILLINLILLISSCQESPRTEIIVDEVAGQSYGNYTIIKSCKISNVNPVGIAALNEYVFITDTTRNLVLRYNTELNILDTIASDLKVCYVNQAASRIPLPLWDKDSLFVFRGDADFYKFQIPIELNNPTCFDGANVNNFALVDQSNHQVVINDKGQFLSVGQYGHNEEDFDTPTAVCLHANKYYVVDSGNKKIKVFDTTGRYLESFGDKDGLIYPTGISSDLIYLFVADSKKDQILVYDGFGTLRDSISQIVTQPSDVFVLKGLIYVCNHKDQTFSIIKKKL